MRIKCIKVRVNSPTSTINGDMSRYLAEGSLFWVYGLSFRENITYCYIFNGKHLFEVPLELFEIVDGGVSPEWIAKRHSDGDLTLWPEIFYKDEFLENFSEHESKERSEFISLREKIEG